MEQNKGRIDEKSKAAFEAAKKVIPGGVNSPVRAFKSVGLTPLFMERGEGSRVYDIDGNVFIDYIASWGPLIMGHTHPEVLEAIKKTAEKGQASVPPRCLKLKWRLWYVSACLL
jgi:glutamate-1-semialdehyde 2,1-aminomutase